jgi:hypothetical protein
MPDGTGTIGDEVSKVVDIKGIRLEIVAYKIGEEQWALYVVNELGIQSHWIDIFDTAEAGITAAENAIEGEGVEAFVDSEGFEYLLH